MGEGAGAIVIETREHAEARGAIPLAQDSGIRSVRLVTNTNPWREPARPVCSARCGLAIQRTQCEKSEIDHVNAHGLGRPAWDRREARAIRALVPGVPVIAPKSYFGNLGAGSGIVEAAVSILGFHRGTRAGDAQPPANRSGMSRQSCRCRGKSVRTVAGPVVEPVDETGR